MYHMNVAVRQQETQQTSGHATYIIEGGSVVRRSRAQIHGA